MSHSLGTPVPLTRLDRPQFLVTVMQDKANFPEVGVGEEKRVFWWRV